MARGVNNVVLIGNLTRDPELRALASGTSVCNLGLAVNESVKNSATGQWEERANFFDITVWGNQGEACAKYLTKGRPVAVQGRLRWESWEKDGQRRSRVTVVAEMVQFLGDGKSSERAAPAATGDLGVPEQGGFGTPAAAPVATPAYDEDIPF